MTQVWEIARSTLQKLLSIRAAQYFIVFGASLEKGGGKGGQREYERRRAQRWVQGDCWQHRIMRGETGGGGKHDAKIPWSGWIVSEKRKEEVFVCLAHTWILQELCGSVGVSRCSASAKGQLMSRKTESHVWSNWTSSGVNPPPEICCCDHRMSVWRNGTWAESGKYALLLSCMMNSRVPPPPCKVSDK